MSPPASDSAKDPTKAAQNAPSEEVPAEDASSDKSPPKEPPEQTEKPTPEEPPRPLTRKEWTVAALLLSYLMLVGVFAVGSLIANFPTEPARVGGEADPKNPGKGGKERPSFFDRFRVESLQRDPTRRLMYVAMVAGILGAFLHAAQSLVAFLGNRKFRMRWCAWYGIRPFIGAGLGIAIHLFVLAGLTGGTNGSANPSGIAIFALLGGWFSQKTTGKLEETMDVFFKNSKDNQLKDKLGKNEEGNPSTGDTKKSEEKSGG